MHEQRCPFERVILSTEFSCSEAHKYFYAHKEGIACKNPPARLNCQLLVEYLKQNSKFALRQAPQAEGKLTHGQEMKLKCGGLLGLQSILEEQADIHSLVNMALQQSAELKDLPWDRILASVQAYKLRQGRTSR